jgi:hypothetical protein
MAPSRTSAPDVDRLHRELLTTPGRCYDQLRQTLTGTVSLRETWAEVKQLVDAGDDLTNIEPEFLLALDGFSTTDLIRGHSRAVALFVATFGTPYGNNPKNVDYLASYLRRHERDKLMAARAPKRAAKLNAAMPSNAEGRAQLREFIDEILGELDGHIQTLSRKAQRKHAMALKKAEINLQEEGNRLVGYMKTADASMHACLRRIEAMQKADRVATGPPGSSGVKGPRVRQRTAPAPGNAGEGEQRAAPTRRPNANGPAAPADSDRDAGGPPPHPPGAESTWTEGVTSAVAAETLKETPTEAPAEVRTTLVDSTESGAHLEELPSTHADATSGSPGALDIASIEAISGRPPSDAGDSPGSAPDNSPSTTVEAPVVDTTTPPVFTNEAKTSEAFDIERVTVRFEAPLQGPPTACGGPGFDARPGVARTPPHEIFGARQNADPERRPPASAPAKGQETESNFPRPP